VNIDSYPSKGGVTAGHQWLTPVILGTQEAEIRIAVQSQPRQTVCETLSQENPSQKKGWWSGSRCSPEFKPQYCKKINKIKEE
jgi:hypothetical protein